MKDGAKAASMLQADARGTERRGRVRLSNGTVAEVVSLSNGEDGMVGVTVAVYWPDGSQSEASLPIRKTQERYYVADGYVHDRTHRDVLDLDEVAARLNLYVSKVSKGDE